MHDRVHLVRIDALMRVAGHNHENVFYKPAPHVAILSIYSTNSTDLDRMTSQSENLNEVARSFKTQATSVKKQQMWAKYRVRAWRSTSLHPPNRRVPTVVHLLHRTGAHRAHHFAHRHHFAHQEHKQIQLMTTPCTQMYSTQITCN